MISISKTQFVVLGFVMVTVLLISVNDVFADHAEVVIVTVDESGFSQTCAESQGGSGCYTPVTATVDVGGVVTMTNTDPTGVHTYTSGTVDGFAPSPDGTFDTGVLMSGDAFEWIPESAGEQPYYCMLHTWMIGTIIVQEAAAEEVEVVQLTINSFEIYEDGDYTRYHVIGDAPASTNLTFTMTKPDGSNGDYNGSAGTGQPSYNQDGLVSPNSDLVYGTWNLEICAAEHNMCVQESFTINQPASADTTPPVVSVPNDFTFTTTDSNGNGQVTIPQLSFESAGFPPTATDDVDGNVDAFCSATNSLTSWDHLASWGGWHYEVYPFESTTVTCIATDESGNEGTASFTITVTDSSADHSNDHGLQMLTWSVNVVPPSIYQPAESIVLEMEGTLDLINTDRNHFIKFHIKNPDGVEVKTIGAYFRDGEFYTADLLIFNDFGIHSVEWTYTGTSETISIPKGFLGTFEVVDSSASSADIELITPTVTASAFLNSTSSTGRTLTVNMGDWRDELTANAGNEYWQVLYKITDPNGIMTSINDPTGLLYYTPLPVDFYFAGYSTLEHQTQWSVEILSSWEPGVYTINSTVYSGATWNDPVLVGPYSTTVTIPALDSADTTPPVITITAQSGLTNLISDGLDFAIVSGGESSGTFEFKVSAIDNIGVMVGVTCSSNGNTIPLLYDNTLGLYQSYKPIGELPFAYPVGSSIISCTGNGSGNVGSASFTVTVIEDTDSIHTPATSNFAPEISPTIGNANYLAQTNQQAHEFSGNTAKVYVTFNGNVPTMGSLINIVSVFPNSQTGVSLNNVNVPYTLTYPGGVEEGTLTSINTSDYYDMVLSINNPSVAGHYTFQTELISTSFDVYDTSTAEGQQASQDAATLNDFNTHKITMDIINESDNKFFINESFTIQGHWINPTSNTVPIRVVFSSESGDIWNTSVELDSNNNFETTLNLSDFAVKGEGYYWIRAEPSTNTIFDVEQIWLIEEKSNASIQITADKTTLDRNIEYDFAEVTINYQNLNSVASFIIQTPDGVDHNVGGFSTNAYLTSGQQGMTTGNVGIYDFANQFNSFTYAIDDGATRGELEFQIIGDFQILANHTITTVAESGFSPDCVETGCYTPSNITVDVGDLINMTNTDPTGLPHTFTAGTVDGFAQNPSGVFDSGFMEAGDSFTWTPQTDVDQPYYCMLHVWMVGTIVVGDVDVAEQIPEPEPVGETWGELGSVYHRFDGPYDFLQTQVTSNIIRSDVIAEILLNGEVLREYTPATDHNGAFYYSRNITDDPAGIFEFRLLTTTNDLLDRECYSWNGFVENPNNKSVNCNTSFPIPEQIAEADTIPPVVEEMTVSTSKEVSLGELLKISIIASHKTSVTIEIIDPSGNIADNTLSCNTTKEFICETFWLVPEEILPGMYTVKVNDGIHSDQITFDVEGESFPIFITQNQNITLDATTTSNGAIVNYELPQATIPGSGVDLGITCTPSSGSFFQTGTTEVICSASDWVGNVGTTSFTVTVKSLIAAPIEIITDVSITIGKSQYNTDEAIFVTGIATPFTENNVSIQVEDSSDNVVLVEQITPESSGIYTGIIFPNFLWSTSGNYTMSATYGNSTANTSFGFEFIEPVIDEYLSPTGITLQTDTSMYAIGDTITIESALTDVGSDYQIGIFVKDPTGELRAMQFLNTDDSGSISLSLKAQDNWIAGEYVVGAYDVLDNSATIRDEVYFDLVKPIPEITISPTVTTTESGDAITSYDAGDMAYFSTSLLSESTSDVLVTINVVDADDTTLGVAFFKSIVGKGDSELVLGFKIPEDTADGAAKIYVNTYTDWIDNGGIVIGSELLSEVNIDGVIVEVVEETVVEEVVEETILPENTIPRLSTVTDITQLASFTTGSVVSYSLPLTTSGATNLDATCTPAPGSMFPIGSTQVTCTATNDFGNTGMTSFMVTINPVVQVADQSLSVKVGKDLYNNLEPLFVTGSVGTVTGEPINLEVRDTQNNLISIEQVTPKESGVYSGVLASNELWDNPGEYTIIAKYEGVLALDTFEFELIEVEEVIPEKIPTSLFIDTLDSAYVLGDVVAIGVNLVDAGAGESILLEVKDSQNDQVLIQSLNTDSNGIAVFLHQLDSSGEPGVYSVTTTSDEWNFSNSENFIAVAQIPDITIGNVVSTLQDGTEVDSFESGDMGYFQTPIISESVSDVLITVNIFDVEKTLLGLSHFNSKVVDDTFDITLGLQIPKDAAPGLATVYINTYTDWPNEGGVPILEEQVSFIEISPSSTTSLTVSSEESEPTPEPVVEQVVNCGPGTENVNGICETPITGNISVNTESTFYTTGNTIVISGSIQNLTEYEQPVVILIVSPDGNLVTIDQVSHDSSGNYSTIVTAGGTMNSSGEYEVRAQYGASKITSTFDFTRN